jgi:predicted GNAT superfamily acetyltransferase
VSASSSEAWDRAIAAGDRAGVGLRPFDRLEDAERVRTLVDVVWGAQVMPPELLRAFQHAGSVLIGAEVGEETVGFVFGFAGLDPRLHLHSHMLAVLPPWRSHGVGVALKLAQRAWCIERGIDEVRWTYDPLVSRNAHLNLVKLGAEAVAFFEGFYGEMDDRLNRGDRTDRFEVRWRVGSDRAEHALDAALAAPPLGAAVLEALGEGDPVAPHRTGAAPAAGATVQIPVDHLALRTADPDLGRKWREEAGGAFAACFRAGLAATWITPERRYVFEAVEDVGGAP